MPVRAYILTDREFDTVLAALRFWQRAGDENQPEQAIADGDHGNGLDDIEIDSLCEDLNTGLRYPGVRYTVPD